MTMQTRRALDDLSWNWGEAYDLAVTRSGWVAKRLDNNRALVACGPGKLRELIIADYTAEPVSRALCEPGVVKAGTSRLAAVAEPDAGRGRHLALIPDVKA
jgi:hypothetical protein